MRVPVSACLLHRSRCHSYLPCSVCLIYPRLFEELAEADPKRFTLNFQYSLPTKAVHTHNLIITSGPSVGPSAGASLGKYTICTYESSGNSHNLILPLNRKHHNLANKQPNGYPHRNLYHPQPQRERAQIRRFRGRVGSVRREESTFQT